MNKSSKNKKAYVAPVIREKEMTGHFMVCQNNSKQCPPGTQIKRAGECL